MIFNRLFCNRGILFQNFRQHGWIGILYLLTLLFSLPLYIGTEYREVPQQITSLFQANGEVQILFAITFPVAAGIFLFRYVQSGAPSDLFHSLPLRRKHLLTVNLVTGFIMILLPIWITTAITGWVWAAVDQPAFIFGGSSIWMWGLSMSIYSLFMFMLTVVVGMCIGQSVLQGLTVYALLLLPVVVWFIFSLHLQHYLLGYPYDDVGRNAEKISLVLRMASISGAPVIGWELIIYSILTLFFIPLSYVFYAKRQVESATQAVTFTLVKPIFRFGLMFTLVLIGGAYFTIIAPRGSSGWGVFGYILGGVVGYIVAEMIIRKTWLIWSSKLLPRFALYGIVAGLILYVPVASWNGYAARVPELNKVNSIKLGGERYTYTNGVSLKLDDGPFYSSDSEYMKAVVALHQKIVDSDLSLLDDPINPGIRNDEYVFINYKLDNGKVMKRKYYIPEAEFRQELMTLKQTQDYKKVAYDTYKLEEDALSIGIRSSISQYRKVYISNPEQVREFKELLSQDIMDQTYEEQRSPWQSFANAEINQDSSFENPSQPKEMSYFEIKPSYDRVLGWLKENKYYEQLDFPAEEVASAQFVKQEINSPGNPQFVYPQSEYVDGNVGNKQVATKNKKIISDLLKRQRSAYQTEKDTLYQIKLNVTRGENIYMMLKEEDLTEEMKAILAGQ
ncbi:hypothetical protein [Paenibacillus pabuli]|uniref:hypothetical protein n=1 Tax=Paenibacillus pabuli TaxID=1472 RepID=UPI00200029D6|nr:hypothetical protein [Paenibacillus pabuli]UPK45077.1 hypothetical protein KET34_06135 [Paenibacillus pabuli]